MEERGLDQVSKSGRIQVNGIAEISLSEPEKGTRRSNRGII